MDISEPQRPNKELKQGVESDDKELKEVNEMKEEIAQTSPAEKTLDVPFASKLSKVLVKHSEEKKLEHLVEHMLKVIKSKKEQLQRRLLKHPRKSHVLLLKYELSTSWLFFPFWGYEKYPYYLDDTCDFLTVGSTPKYFEMLTKGIVDILELENVKTEITIKPGVSIISGQYKVPEDGYDTVRLRIIQ